MVIRKRIDYDDTYVAVPGVDTGLGAWMPLNEDQQRGLACLDCGSGYGWFAAHRVGVCDYGPVNVCQPCYEHRLRGHIDYYRPHS